jgi:hypothetical protein
MTDACISPIVIAAAREARSNRWQPIMAGQINPNGPIADQVNVCAAALSGMIESQELRRLPADTLTRLRGISMSMLGLAGVLHMQGADARFQAVRANHRASWWFRVRRVLSWR